MAVTVVKGTVTAQDRPDAHAATPSANPHSLAQLVTKAASTTEAAVVRVRASGTRQGEPDKVRDFSEATAKSKELSKSIREESNASDAHSEMEPKAAGRALAS